MSRYFKRNMFYIILSLYLVLIFVLVFQNKTVEISKESIPVEIIEPIPTDQPTGDIPKETETSYNHNISSEIYPKKINFDQLNCLSMNIYYEARNQSVIGQRAVAYVTLNRVMISDFPDTICGVVYQRSWNKKYRKFINQFSWISCRRCTNPKDKKAWKVAKNIAQDIMTYYGTKNSIDPTHGALFYHADYVSPKWRRIYKETVKIETHIFYKMGVKTKR